MAKPMWTIETESDGVWHTFGTSGQYASKAMAEDEANFCRCRNPHRKYRVVQIGTTPAPVQPPPKVIPMPPRMDLVHPQITGWMARARNAMRDRRAIKFDELVRECDAMIGGDRPESPPC